MADIKNFTHVDLKVQVGTEVTWMNGGGVPHTTTSGTPGDADAGSVWDSITLTGGTTFAFTFDKVGTFPYHCRVHPATMKGTVTVVENLGAVPSSSSDSQPTKGAGGIYNY